ncbi:MAG: CBS domain-containing protein, partial [Betaproteobacteria bacterium HGW-Betaproteobacteria-17]
MAVGEICNREVVVAEKALSVVDAAQLMRKHHVGDLVVVEETAGRRHPVGIVTDRDIVVEVVAAGVNPDALKVGDIMGPEVATVRESEGLFEA